MELLNALSHASLLAFIINMMVGFHELRKYERNRFGIGGTFFSLSYFSVNFTKHIKDFSKITQDMVKKVPFIKIANSAEAWGC